MSWAIDGEVPTTRLPVVATVMAGTAGVVAAPIHATVPQRRAITFVRP
jgi:hypothetical protein